ncbi:hypothetical protein DPX16_4703 [Anabarilius grahami]|uniref:Uncharacterized protein n=1 Tax=Anabarilius grahami TaxID=495550 RepID=A0A3N0YGI8_ANAGA|nr:hypothetical protein DPX16_4703 [Anabarilius grahami]
MGKSLVRYHDPHGRGDAFCGPPQPQTKSATGHGSLGTRELRDKDRREGLKSEKGEGEYVLMSACESPEKTTATRLRSCSFAQGAKPGALQNSGADQIGSLGFGRRRGAAAARDGLQQHLRKLPVLPVVLLPGVDTDGFMVVLEARRCTADLQTELRIPATSRLATADSVYLHPQAPEKEAARPGPCRFREGLA